jgi:hypothetical protein
MSRRTGKRYAGGAVNTVCQRQRGESLPDRAYRIYRDLGPKRSLARAWCVYRETGPELGKSRGRPRLAHAKAGHPSGQWTSWSSELQWAERAADYDAQLDAEKGRTRLEQIQEVERRRLKAELEAQEQLEELVGSLEAQLDRMDSFPVTGFTVWEREVQGRKVTASKTHLQSVSLFGYARLLRAVDEAARWAIVGPREATGQRSPTSGDNFSAASALEAPDTNSSGSSIASAGRMPGESAAAYRAFCAYRDQGPKRSLVAAQMADRPKAEPATRASAGYWAVWSSRWNWVARAKAYDEVVASTRRRAQRHCDQQLEQRRFEFECRNQERLETRVGKIGVLVSRAAQAPTTDITEWTVSRTGSRVYKRKTHMEGLNVAGFANVADQYMEAMRQAVNRVGHNRRPRRSALPSRL